MASRRVFSSVSRVRASSMPAPRAASRPAKEAASVAVTWFSRGTSSWETSGSVLLSSMERSAAERVRAVVSSAPSSRAGPPGVASAGGTTWMKRCPSRFFQRSSNRLSWGTR